MFLVPKMPKENFESNYKKASNKFFMYGCAFKILKVFRKIWWSFVHQFCKSKLGGCPIPIPVQH